MKITIPCLYCDKENEYEESTCVGSGECNAFCDDECEDKYAFKQ